MALIFKGCELRPVLAEAQANGCRVLLVKDEGVYWLSEHGERLPSGQQKLLAYAVGCNPNSDDFDTWYGRARTELGGDDFAEHFDLDNDIFQRILYSGDDLELVASSTHLQLRCIAPGRAPS
ncbi:DUF3085 domain-containing protein [Pseudomonas aeruginosa]